MKRDLATLQDLNETEVNYLLELAQTLKDKKKEPSDHLKGKTIALLFQKPSNRTRVSFEVGTIQLGGYCLYLSPREINLGKRESTSDVAKTLSRYVDGIVARTFSHDDILELGKAASVPVINALSDLYHPCQGLADIFSIKEKFGKLKGLTLTYVGDGNNVCHSLLLAASKTGLNMKIATPKGLEVAPKVLEIAKKNAEKTGSRIYTSNDPIEAATGADVIYSDVWISMGQEDQTEEKLKKFSGFQVNDELTALANKDYIFMHCLPAHRGEEVTAEVIDGQHSIVFDQAENRLHVQKAVLVFLLGEA